ncbi:Uncharacterized protein BM_BM2634 [Brugia malayi]|uniref:BMA-GLB-11 n=3 Tax=Brugia TaxID=6278 RepID=A0A0K0J6U2_BRUMA|nr:Uncharacterized protein BM_BM2634 [Brugia malayi]CTP80899.1 BMA-GLB-11 [Brugia malayi]VDO25583.1 unnamed protein product [Brugia timori]VIO92028.1 Uncharacterized protein BM_BM2634 [Brugia malayi]
MGNIGSAGSNIKEQPRTDLSDNEPSSSQQQVARKTSQPMLLKNPRPSISSQGRKTSVLVLSQRQIVKGCMDKAKDDIAERIYRRIIEKRDDFRKFVEALSEEQRCELANSLRSYLKNVVNQLMDRAAVQRISEDFGARHVQYRSSGFRPDFFAITADAVTTECVLLDAAVHSASEALFAWSTLTTFMFSSVRDGYYSEQRRLRKTSQQCINRNKISLPAALIETINRFDNGRKFSNVSYNSEFFAESDVDEMNELENSKSIAKWMEEEEAKCRSKMAVRDVAERIEILETGDEANDSIQGDMTKHMTTDVHRQLRIAFHARRDSTI